jgi:hypothetical protein
VFRSNIFAVFNKYVFATEDDFVYCTMAGPDDFDAVAKTVPALIELSAFTEPIDIL